MQARLAMGDHDLRRAWTSLPRLLRFFVVGGVNTVFGYCAYASLLLLGFHYAGAALLGTIAGVIFNYCTTGGLVFDGVGRERFVPFVAVYAVLYALNVAALAVLQDLVIGGRAVGPYRAGLILIVPMALVSYALMRRFVFGGRRAAD